MITRVGPFTFYLQGERWVDSRLTVKKSEMKLLELAWLSKEYFEFLKAHPRAGRILALGSEITFIWNARVIRVVSK